ncbi:MAG: tetratricopeptide repeat protein, partial [Lewinella sp.]|nr:tetratricopeptide repeat protein [Lewinella sp.]
LDSLRWVAYVQNAFGILEREENNFPQALRYYQQAYDLLFELGYTDLSAVPLSNIGDIYLLQGQYEDALNTFNKSLAMRQQDETTGTAIAHLNIGQSWRGLGNFEQALLEIRLGLKMAESNGFRKVESFGLKDLSETFKKMGMPDSALYYLEIYQSLSDSLQKEENKAQLENLFVAYETEKAQHEAADRQKRILLLENEKRLEYLSNYFIISLLVLALIISSAFFIRNRILRKLAESELRNERLESEQMRRELEGKQKDLTNLALEIARKNEVFTQTNEALSRLQKGELPPEKKKQIRQLIQFNAQQLRINEDLEELQINIEQVNADFFEKLSQVAPDLTPSEKQLSALIRLNLSTKDIASIRNISPKSVEMARYRLRKKLPIEAQDDIYEFVQKI